MSCRTGNIAMPCRTGGDAGVQDRSINKGYPAGGQTGPAVTCRTGNIAMPCRTGGGAGVQDRSINKGCPAGGQTGPAMTCRTENIAMSCIVGQQEKPHKQGVFCRRLECPARQGALPCPTGQEAVG